MHACVSSANTAMTVASWKQRLKRRKTILKENLLVYNPLLLSIPLQRTIKIK